MVKKTAFIAMLLVSCVIFADSPTFSITVDSQYPSRPFEVTVFEESTPVVTASLKSNKTNYVFAAGMGAVFEFSLEDRGYPITTVQGTLTTNGIAQFSFASTDLPDKQEYLAQIVVTNATKNIIWGQGRLNVN